MSGLTEFYDETSPDCCGRNIAEIWAASDDYLEYAHDWIQWLFPLQEPSNFNPDAPLLTDEDIIIFKANPTIQENLRSSFGRYLAFFGLILQDGEVVATEAFEPIQFKLPNHNWLRITRVLNSCKLLGLEKEAIAFFNFLKQIHEEYGWVSDNSFRYWKEAVNGVVEVQ